jgi:hypothetical protein
MRFLRSVAGYRLIDHRRNEDIREELQIIDIFLSLLQIRPIGLFQFRITSEITNHRQMVGLFGRVISSSQSLNYRYKFKN